MPLSTGFTGLTMSIAMWGSGLAAAQVVTTRVSVDSSGVEGDDYSITPVISPNGRDVAFTSNASNLVASDTNGKWDVFVHYGQVGVTRRVSLRSDGTEGNQNSWSYRSPVSSDGRLIVFDSNATNLVTGDTNQASDVFVHDLLTGISSRVSVSSNGVQADSASYCGSMSMDGRYIAFVSHAGNLVPNHAAGTGHVFVRDLQAGTTTLASSSSLGVEANASSDLCVISRDGHWVAFQSDATNLVLGDTNGSSDVFVRNLVTGSTSRASVDSFGVQGNQVSYAPSLSFDGRYVAFHSLATNLVGGDTNSTYDVFVHDCVTGATVRVSVDSGGTEGNALSGNPSLSSDGRRVAFRSIASNLVVGDTNGNYDAFTHDLATGVTARISQGPGGVQVQGFSAEVSMSSTGRFIAYASTAPDIVPADYNGKEDVFVIDTGAAPVAAFCTAGVTSNGCVPSISGVGDASASAGLGFTIHVQQVEGLKQGLVFYGINNAGFTPHLWGASTSWLCVKSPLQRTPPQDSGGSFSQCNGALSIDLNSFLATHPSALGQPFLMGSQVFAQAWFRDPPSPKTTMLSNALQFFVEP